MAKTNTQFTDIISNMLKKSDFYKSLGLKDKKILHELNLVISDYYSFIGEINNPNYINSKDMKILAKACLFWYNLRIDELEGFRNKKHDKIFLKIYQQNKYLW